MKTQIQMKLWAAMGCLMASLAAGLSQTASGQTAGSPPVMPPVDPNTGLPLPAQPAAEPRWIDAHWSDPDLILTNVSYDGLPIAEVARSLRDQFKRYFDILPMPSTYDKDWGDNITIQLQLRNVKASEVFNAMNLVFENDHTPVRWELRWEGGNRPLALLRVLPEAAPQAAAEAAPESPHRMVYFVGNLIGDTNSGGMSMEQIVQTVKDVWPADLGKPDEVIQFHTAAQIIIVNGGREQLDFIRQTLAALQQKVQAARPKPSEARDLEELSNLIRTLKEAAGGSK